MEAPTSYEAAAALLREAGEAGRTVRPQGGGTKLGWGAPAGEPELVLSTSRLDRIVEHNAGDLTAVLQAGVPLAAAQEAFAAAGQMLALDPPLGPNDAATVGGIVATADAGPLRHRYGAARDLLLGVTVALADGTVARAGGKVIKNVAGYDLAKLFAGSFGTLGVVAEVVVRLHPLPAPSATAVGSGAEPAALARAAVTVAGAPLELEALDVSWADGNGRLLARVAGAAAAARADRVAALLREAGLDPSVEHDDEALWAAQRAGQRAPDGVVLRASTLPGALQPALRTAEALGASLVGRAGAGVVWLRLPPAEDERLAAGISEVRRRLAPHPCVVLDAPGAVRERVDVWGVADAALLALSRRVKERFDPRGACNAEVFAGGI